MPKRISFVRHAQGFHNQATQRAGGSMTPIDHTTPGAWRFRDSALTPKGVAECLAARDAASACAPTLVVVSPLVRAIQTAHLMFGGRGIPFMVHHTCRERWGKYTCDARQSRAETVAAVAPAFAGTGDTVDFDSWGFPSEEDTDWTVDREPSDHCRARGLEFVRWLRERPEREMAVVSHGSFLRHLLSSPGWMADHEPFALEDIMSNAEVRTITLVN